MRHVSCLTFKPWVCNIFQYVVSNHLQMKQSQTFLELFYIIFTSHVQKLFGDLLFLICPRLALFWMITKCYCLSTLNICMIVFVLVCSREIHGRFQEFRMLCFQSIVDHVLIQTPLRKIWMCVLRGQKMVGTFTINSGMNVW